MPILQCTRLFPRLAKPIHLVLLSSLGKVAPTGEIAKLVVSPFQTNIFSN